MMALDIWTNALARVTVVEVKICVSPTKILPCLPEVQGRKLV